MFQYLCEHPEISGSNPKETHYYDSYYDNGIDYYKARFNANGERYIVEATPHYLVRDWVPERLKADIDDPKFIVLLRDPVERVWSHYCRRRMCKDVDFGDMTDTSIEPYQQGLYAQHLKLWFTHFKRDHFMIYPSEAFYILTGKVMKNIFWKLDLYAIEHKHYPVVDPCAGVGREKFPMPEDIREIAEDFYRKPNQELYDLLGVDYGW